MTSIGHNGIAADRLKSFVERIERLAEEKAALQEDIKEVFTKAKGAGFDPKIMRKLIQERKMALADRQEMEELLSLYRNALGDYASTDLGKAGERGITGTQP